MNDFFLLFKYLQTSLKSLDLISLKIIHGTIEIISNKNLCYASNIDWTKIQNNNETRIITKNRNPLECGMFITKHFFYCIKKNFFFFLILRK